MNQLQSNIIQELKENGIAKSHVKDLFDNSTLRQFGNSLQFFNNFISSSHIQNRCKRIAEGNPIRDRNKWYEITQYEYLNRALGLDDGDVINMYLSPILTEMAEAFHGTTPKLRNVLTWIHPQNALKSEMASQIWHRDQEDWAIFKVFIYFSNITSKNGALKYAKKTQHGGKYGDITNNMNGQSTSQFRYSLPEEEIVIAEGEIGTIYFVNTNGLHKGGLVDEGIRRLTQANYLNPNAPLIQNGTLGTFNYSDKVNSLDTQSESYTLLTNKQQLILS